MPYSVKSQRVLERLGVPAAFARGEQLVLAGPTYERRNEAGVHLRLAFIQDDERGLCVGVASDAGGAWQLVDAEPFSFRALGYQQRHLKRIGDRVEQPRSKR